MQNRGDWGGGLPNPIFKSISSIREVPPLGIPGMRLEREGKGGGGLLRNKGAGQGNRGIASGDNRVEAATRPLHDMKFARLSVCLSLHPF